MVTFMPSICFARDRSVDSLVLFRVWNYAKNHPSTTEEVVKNVYMQYTFKVNRRNPTLFLIPTMYSIAKGDREFVGESYYKMRFHNAFQYDIRRQVLCGTVPHNRSVMPSIFEYATPDLYNETLYQGKILSPFYYSNRYFYKYRVTPVNSRLFIVRFRPRTNNTQMIKGYAFVDLENGCINTCQFDAEFDMIAELAKKSGASYVAMTKINDYKLAPAKKASYVNDFLDRQMAVSFPASLT